MEKKLYLLIISIIVNTENQRAKYAHENNLLSLVIVEKALLLLLLLSRFSRVRLCATPQAAAHQAPLSLGFSRQEHWGGVPFPSPMHVQAVLLQSLLYNRKTREVTLLEVTETDPEFTAHSSLDFGALI